MGGDAVAGKKLAPKGDGKIAVNVGDIKIEADNNTDTYEIAKQIDAARKRAAASGGGPMGAGGIEECDCQAAVNDAAAKGEAAIAHVKDEHEKAAKGMEAIAAKAKAD